MNEKQYDDLISVLDEAIRAVEHAKRQVSQIYYRENQLLAPGDRVVNKPRGEGGNGGMVQGLVHTIREVVPSEWIDPTQGIRRTHYYIFEPGTDMWHSAWSDQVVPA